jgi:hypothetical protein
MNSWMTMTATMESALVTSNPLITYVHSMELANYFWTTEHQLSVLFLPQ